MLLSLLAASIYLSILGVLNIFFAKLNSATGLRLIGAGPIAALFAAIPAGILCFHIPTLWIVYEPNFVDRIAQLFGVILGMMLVIQAFHWFFMPTLGLLIIWVAIMLLIVEPYQWIRYGNLKNLDNWNFGHQITNIPHAVFQASERWKRRVRFRDDQKARGFVENANDVPLTTDDYASDPADIKKRLVGSWKSEDGRKELIFGESFLKSHNIGLSKNTDTYMYNYKVAYFGHYKLITVEVVTHDAENKAVRFLDKDRIEYAEYASLPNKHAIFVRSSD